MPFFLQVLGKLAFDLADQVAVALGQRIQPLHHDRIGFRIERTGTRGPRAPRAFPACPCGRRAAHRCPTSPRRCGGARRRHEFQRAHVVQAVGELDQQHANVVGDRQQQLAQVLGLLGLARDQLQPLQLGEALHQRADLVAEDACRSRRGSPRYPRWCRAAARRRWWRRRASGRSGSPRLRADGRNRDRPTPASARRAPSWRRRRRG